LTTAPVPPSTTAASIAGRFTRDRVAGIETGLGRVYRRWLAVGPAAVRAALVLRNPTIDLDASDVEVFGRTKRNVGWTYAGVRAARVHLAWWAQAELPLADLCSPATTTSAQRPVSCCSGRWRCSRARCAAGLGSGPTPATSTPRSPRRRPVGLRLRGRRQAQQRRVAGLRGDPGNRLEERAGHARRAGRGLRLGPGGLARRQLHDRPPGQDRRGAAVGRSAVPPPPDRRERPARAGARRRRRPRLGDQLHRHQHPGRQRRLRRPGSVVSQPDQHRGTVPRGQARRRREPPAPADPTVNTVWMWAGLLAGATSVMLQALTGPDPRTGGRTRIATLRHRLLAVPGRLIRHARGLTLRLPPDRH